MKFLMAVVLTSAVGATGAVAEISAEQVAGRTLTLNKSKFVIGVDGSLTGQTERGDVLVGSWQVVDGKWCRTITEPQRLAGKACQAASIKGRNLTLIREDGSTLVYKIK